MGQKIQTQRDLEVYQKAFAAAIDEIIRTVIGMINHPETWVIGKS